MASRTGGWADCSPDDLFDLFKSGPQGLPDDHISDLRKVYGLNKLDAGKDESFFELFLNHLTSLAAVILVLFSAVVMGWQEYNTGFVLLGICVIENFVATNQQYRVKKGSKEFIANLPKGAATCTTIRGGKPREVDPTELVRGDVVDLKPGDIVPADCRVFECKDLKVTETIYQNMVPTGCGDAEVPKSLEVEEDEEPKPIAPNVCCMCSTVARGTGKGMAIRTGKDTILGQLVVQELQRAKTMSFWSKALLYLGTFIFMVGLWTAIARSQDYDLMQHFRPYRHPDVYK